MINTQTGQYGYLTADCRYRISVVLCGRGVASATTITVAGYRRIATALQLLSGSARLA